MLLRLAHQANQAPESDDPAVQELNAARKELALAWHQFDQAAQAYVDPAIHRLIAAEQTYFRLLSEQRNHNERNDENHGKEESQSGASVQVLG